MVAAKAKECLPRHAHNTHDSAGSKTQIQRLARSLESLESQLVTRVTHKYCSKSHLVNPVKTRANIQGSA